MTGRRDCIPNPDLDRPWMSNNKETHPSPNGSGKTTISYYMDHIGLTAREAVALNGGAHSFGNFHDKVSLAGNVFTF